MQRVEQQPFFGERGCTLGGVGIEPLNPLSGDLITKTQFCWRFISYQFNCEYFTKFICPLIHTPSRGVGGGIRYVFNLPTLTERFKKIDRRRQKNLGPFLKKCLTVFQ